MKTRYVCDSNISYLPTKRTAKDHAKLFRPSFQPVYILTLKFAVMFFHSKVAESCCCFNPVGSLQQLFKFDSCSILGLFGKVTRKKLQLSFAIFTVSRNFIANKIQKKMRLIAIFLQRHFGLQQSQKKAAKSWRDCLIQRFPQGKGSVSD